MKTISASEAFCSCEWEKTPTSDDVLWDPNIHTFICKTCRKMMSQAFLHL